MRVHRLIVMVVLWITWVGGSVASVHSSTGVKLEPATVDLTKAGAQFTVDLRVHDVENLLAFSVTVTFDPTVVSITKSNVVSGEFMTSYGQVWEEVHVGLGSVKYEAGLIEDNGLPTGSGVLARLTFSVLQTKSGKLSITEAELFDGDLSTIPVAWTSGARLTAGAIERILPGIISILLE